MPRPLSLPELRRQGSPLGLLAIAISRHTAMLKTLCFSDNERGSEAKVDHILKNRVVTAVNRELGRGGKMLRLLSLTVNPTRHHHLEMQYTHKVPVDPLVPDTLHVVVAEPLSFALFEPSKKAQAMERKALEDGEEREFAAPRRGGSTSTGSRYKAKATAKAALVGASQAKRRARH